MAMSTSIPYDNERGQDIIELFVDRGHNITDSDGPYGTIEHSLITGVFMNWTEPCDVPQDLCKVLQRNGANPCKKGTFGNALEFLWRVLHSPRMIREIRDSGLGEDDYMSTTAYAIPVLKYLLKLEVSNKMPDPNGKVPSVQDMRSLLEITPVLNTKKQVQILFASFYRYYGGNFEDAEFAGKLLSMTDEEFSKMSYSDDDWNFQQQERLQAEAVKKAAVEKETGV